MDVSTASRYRASALEWRAQIRRTAGISGAHMPFYGKTPDEAATLLTRWLSIANGRPKD